MAVNVPKSPKVPYAAARGTCAQNFRRMTDLLGGLGVELIAVEHRATLLRCNLSLHVTEPAHPQSGDAIRDLANMFGGIFFALLGVSILNLMTE